MEKFLSVWEFLQSHAKERPVTFKEITDNVDKSRSACYRELNGLMARFMVVQVAVWFNNKKCPFYTVRKDVQITKFESDFTFKRLMNF